MFNFKKDYFMKNFFINTLFCLALFSLNSCSKDAMEFDKTQEAPIDPNANARNAGEKLLSSFGKTATRSLSDDEYPDYYGGGYIEEGKLIVFIKREDFIKNRSAVINTTDTDYISFREGDYSYKELKTVLTEIADYIEQNPLSENAANIKCSFLNDFENNIVVELEDCSDSSIEDFKNKINNFSGIIFKQSSREFIEHALAPGSPIYAKINNNLYPNSVGYAAMRFGTTGYITAGHGFGTNSKVYTASGLEIGTCQLSVHSGSTDAAFIVPTNFNYYVSNGDLTGEELTIWAGDNVTKRGQTIAQSPGYIVSTSVTVSSKNQVTGVSTTLRDMAEATYLSAGGDSGGPVYLTANKKIVGIHQSGTAFTSIFCKVSNIRSSLNAYYY